MATQTPPSSKRITLFNPATKETKNPLETDPIIDTLLEKGFQVITTPPKPTADYITIYDPDTKETQNVDKNDPNLQDLMDDGFEIVTTPPRPKTPKLDAKTLYVTDAERLKAYANGTLDPSQTAGLEQVLGEMQRPSTVVENGQQVTRPAKAFSLPIVEAIRAREEAGYPTSTFDLPEKVEVSKAVLSIEQQPTLSGKITALQQYRDKNTGKLPKKLLNSKVFAETLLGESGNADLDSDSWRMIPTQIFDEKADYNLARGLSTIPDRLVSAFVELTGTSRVLVSTMKVF